MRDGEKDKEEGHALDRENDFQLEWIKPSETSPEVEKKAKSNRVKKLLQKLKRK